MSDELDDLALTTPDGTVFDACENAVITGGRDVQRQLWQNVVARRVEFERGRALLLEQGWAGVCAWVADLLAVEEEGQRERRRQVTDRVVGYCCKHLGRLNYAAVGVEARDRQRHGGGPGQDLAATSEAAWRPLEKGERVSDGQPCVRPTF